MSKLIRPEKSFIEMLLLILKNHRVPSAFTPQILMAIFWEESQFRNVKQISGGPGVGFGQVEKQNLFHLNQPKAREKGYFVPGVTSNTTQLDDDRSTQISHCYLLHLFHHEDAQKSSDKKEFAYKGYGGVLQAKGTSVSKDKRLATIRGWQACELKLSMLPFDEFRILNFPGTFTELEDHYLDALSKARLLDPNLRFPKQGGGTETLREVLFPRYWFFPSLVRQQISQFLPVGSFLRSGSQGRQVSLLQRMLNAQPLPPRPPLATDGLFGPKTHAGVRGFQQTHNLVADGIVGPNTRRALV